MNKNEPAFPKLKTNWIDAGLEHYFEGGLTKREYFAAAALTGLCTKVRVDGNPNPSFERAIALDALYVADALLEELDK